MGPGLLALHELAEAPLHLVEDDLRHAPVSRLPLRQGAGERALHEQARRHEHAERERDQHEAKPRHGASSQGSPKR